MPELELGPLWLSLQLASVTAIVLLVVATPLAWWLAFTRNRFSTVVEAVVAMPLVLPPTVLGFYLLLLLGPRPRWGRLWVRLTDSTLTFSFTGLLVASALYSLRSWCSRCRARSRPSAARRSKRRPLCAPAPRSFFTVAVPLSLRGFLTAVVLTFAHTLGEFGVVLMVGGNIPGKTRVISIAIYEHVETIEYAQAHVLAARVLLTFSFSVLLLVYTLNRRMPLVRV